MNVQLKNVKYSAFASQETHCFEATVYIDGKRVGTVSNEGFGGPDSYSSQELYEKLTHIASQMPPIDMSAYGIDKTMPASAETLIGDLMNKYLQQKEVKRLCAKKTLFRIAGKTYQKGMWNTVARPFSAEVKAYLIGKYGEHVFILNENPGSGLD